MPKKDIFIDNNIAKNFTNPLDPEYKKLIKWLLTYHKIEETDAYLVVSNKLLAEYSRSNKGAASGTNIAVVINKLTQEGRLVKVSNQDIKKFQEQYFAKKITKKMQSNSEDREHIPVVLLSDRKFALSLDDGFIHDLELFSSFDVKAEKRPEDLPYNK